MVPYLAVRVLIITNSNPDFWENNIMNVRDLKTYLFKSTKLQIWLDVIINGVLRRK